MAVITISRQYGSGAEEIAMRICDLLGYHYFDKTLMGRVALEVGLSKDEVVDFSEDTYKMRSFLERLFGRPMPAQHAEEDLFRTDILDEARSVNLVRDTLIGAYNLGNVVIVGRGGQAILRDKPGVLHVRIEAPLGARALRIKERDGISLDEAGDLAMRKELAAAAYLRRFFEIDWANPLLYHLILNTGKWEIEAATQIIISAVNQLPTFNIG